MFHENRWSLRSIFLLIVSGLLFILPAYIFAQLLLAFTAIALPFGILLAIGAMVAVLVSCFTGYRRMQLLFILIGLVFWYTRTH